uniref:Pco075430a n=1 Tax=Arundo donax TaxID=35708 RepID=A0A0A9E4Y5_ARUDO
MRILLIATVFPVLVSMALKTTPYVPSPTPSRFR